MRSSPGAKTTQGRPGERGRPGNGPLWGAALELRLGLVRGFFVCSGFLVGLVFFRCVWKLSAEGTAREGNTPAALENLPSEKNHTHTAPLSEVRRQNWRGPRLRDAGGRSVPPLFAAFALYEVYKSRTDAVRLAWRIKGFAVETYLHLHYRANQMGISMHIFTARDLIHLRQSRPSGHGITDREVGGGFAAAGTWAEKVRVPGRCRLPGTPRSCPPCRGKQRGKITSPGKRVPSWGKGTAPLAQSKALRVFPPREMGFNWQTWGEKEKETPRAEHFAPRCRRLFRLLFSFISRRVPRETRGRGRVSASRAETLVSARVASVNSALRRREGASSPVSWWDARTERCPIAFESKGGRREAAPKPGTQGGFCPKPSSPGGGEKALRDASQPPLQPAGLRLCPALQLGFQHRGKRNLSPPPHPVPSGGPLQFHLVSSSFPCKWQ